MWQILFKDFEPGAIAVKDDHELVVGEASGGFNLKVKFFNNFNDDWVLSNQV